SGACHHLTVHHRQSPGRYSLRSDRSPHAESYLMADTTSGTNIANGVFGAISRFWTSLDWPLRIALALLIIFVVVAVFGPWLTPHDPLKGSLRSRLAPPVWQNGGSWDHFFGTDRLGRD